VTKRPQKGGEARKNAMHLYQELDAFKLKEIALLFNLNHINSVRFITHQIRKGKRENKRLLKKLKGYS